VCVCVCVCLSVCVCVSVCVCARKNFCEVAIFNKFDIVRIDDRVKCGTESEPPL
jgi:hypothetical protein